MGLWHFLETVTKIRKEQGINYLTMQGCVTFVRTVVTQISDKETSC